MMSWGRCVSQSWSSGLWHRVVLSISIDSNVSEERSASIFRVTSTPETKTVCSSGTLVSSDKSSWCDNSEYHNLTDKLILRWHQCKLFDHPPSCYFIAVYNSSAHGLKKRITGNGILWFTHCAAQAEQFAELRKRYWSKQFRRERDRGSTSS